MKNANETKAAYASPKLAIYGAFSQLTAGGSVNSGENKGSMIADMA